MFMSHTLFSPSNMDVLVLIPVPSKVKTELLLTSLKENRKNLAPYLAVLYTTLASSISWPSVLLIGDPNVGEVLTT